MFERTWYYHPDGRSRIAESAKQAVALERDGWQEHPPVDGPADDRPARPAEPTPSAQATEAAAITPVQEQLYALTVDSVKLIVDEKSENRLVAKQILIDELDNPNHPGGRKGVVEHCLEKLRSFPPANAPETGE